MPTLDEITTQAAQLIAELSRTLDTLQATAEGIMDQVAEERAALEQAAIFSTAISPNGETKVENQVEKSNIRTSETPEPLGPNDLPPWDGGDVPTW